MPRHLVKIAWTLQLAAQIPQLSHKASSITWGSFFFPVIAPEGHALPHTRHPVQSSGSI